MSARGRAMHARIVPIALGYEERLYKVLTTEERRSFDELTERLTSAGVERSVDVQVTRLRRKIEPDPKNPRYLQTVRGVGYRLAPD